MRALYLTYTWRNKGVGTRNLSKVSESIKRLCSVGSLGSAGITSTNRTLLLAAKSKQCNSSSAGFFPRIMPEITWAMSNMQQADYSTGTLIEEGAHEYKTVSWKVANLLGVVFCSRHMIHCCHYS